MKRARREAEAEKQSNSGAVPAEQKQNKKLDGEAWFFLASLDKPARKNQAMNKKRGGCRDAGMQGGKAQREAQSRKMN